MIRKYQSIDYPLLKQWFKEWDWAVLHEKSIPKTHSYFIESKGKPVAFSCFYSTDSDIAVMGPTLRDPKQSGKVGTEAVDKLIDFIFKTAEEEFNFLWYATDRGAKRIIDRFIDRGALLTDDGDGYIMIKSFIIKEIGYFSEEDYNESNII